MVRIRGVSVLRTQCSGGAFGVSVVVGSSKSKLDIRSFLVEGEGEEQDGR